jgi:hypothetical protein
MAKKHKEDKKPGDKKQKAAVADGAMPQQADAGNREGDMRRIAREAAWARMFGKNASRNPFSERA